MNDESMNMPSMNLSEGTTEKPKDSKNSVKKLLKYMKKYLPATILAIIMSIIYAVLSMIGPNKLSELTDTITEGLMTGIDIEKIKSIAIFLIILYVLGGIFNFIQSMIMCLVANKFGKVLREKIAKKINKLPLKYFDTHKIGDILSRMTNDVSRITQSMEESLAVLMSGMVLLIGTLIMMFRTNVIMAITAIVSSMIGFIFIYMILGKSQKYFDKKQVELGKLNGHIEEVYSSLNIVQTYNAKEKEHKKFSILNKNLFKYNLKSQFLSELMMFFMSFIGNFAYVAVCIIGAILVMNNTITFGVIVAFLVYIQLFTGPLSEIAQGIANMQNTLASSERVFEFIETEEMKSENNIKKVLDSRNVKGNIEFKDVKFGYDQDKLIIKNFSLKAKQGEKIAIVGPTGAGKTTLVNLLMKFYEINDGNIYIDGVNIKELSRENIHELFIMVLQDTWLFNGTIRDNIKYSKEDVTDKEIIEALKTVGIYHFVETLPNKLDYEIADSESISAGEKQLLTIARGIIKNSPFLILDEATSSVDTRTEETIQRAMDRLTIGRTSFIIAHRLSTIKNADKILVMKDGNIVEQGNHNELLEKNGFYAELYNSQFQK